MTVINKIIIMLYFIC